jgi:hypothetical protein
MSTSTRTVQPATDPVGPMSIDEYETRSRPVL